MDQHQQHDQHVDLEGNHQQPPSSTAIVPTAIDAVLMLVMLHFMTYWIGHGFLYFD